MSARQRARLTQQAAIDAAVAEEVEESSESEEDERVVRKPAFAFSDSESDEEKEEVPEDDEEEEDKEHSSDTPIEEEAVKIRERGFSKKKKDTAKNEKESSSKEGSLREREGAEGMSLEELSLLINNSEVTILKSTLLDKEKDNAADPLKALSTLLKVDIKGLDIDSIMKRRFGGMAVNEMPAAAHAGGGAHERRFAAAVAQTDKARARIAKLSNKVYCVPFFVALSGDFHSLSFPATIAPRSLFHLHTVEVDTLTAKDSDYRLYSTCQSPL